MISWFALLALLTFAAPNPQTDPVPPFDPNAQPTHVEFFAVGFYSKEGCDATVHALLAMGSPHRKVQLDFPCTPIQ